MNISIKREQNNARISSAEREKFGAKLKTKTIFKALAMTMLMPAMLLTTACSSEDNLVNNAANTENTINKGYALPVTVNVTREGDATTRATFDGSKLNFGAGDQLFVYGDDEGGAGNFAGTLNYVSGGTFSGTIYTQNSYSGTADALFTAASAGGFVNATLLPDGYGSYGYLSIDDNNTTEEKYDDFIYYNNEYTFATSKAAGVEQFSYEKATSYSSGFALEPKNAILNFTITGFFGNSKVDVSLTGSGYTITKTVTTDNSGNAKFAVGIGGNYDLNNFTLTAGVKAVTIVDSSTPLVKGKIYNITRSATATTLSELKTAINAGKNGSCYTGWEVNSAGAIAASSVSGTKIGYVALVSTSDVDAGVSGSRILVLANADAGTSILWGSYGTSRGLTADDLNGYNNTNTLQGNGSEAHPAAYAAWNYSAAIPSGGATPAHWFMPTKKQWENMRDVYSDSNLNNRKAMESAYGIDGNYWSSTEYNNVRAYRFSTNGGLQYYVKNGTSATNVRAVFAY